MAFFMISLNLRTQARWLFVILSVLAILTVCGAVRASTATETVAIEATATEAASTAHTVSVGTSTTTIATPSAATATAAIAAHNPPSIPTIVDLYLYLEDIGKIDLSQGTFDATAQLLFKWQDPRLAFDPADNNGQLQKVYVGANAQRQLDRMWQPWVEVSGERGLRVVAIQSLTISSNGNVEMHQKFHASPKFTGELLHYPFGRLRLHIAITSVVYDNQGFIMNAKVVDPLDLDELDEVLHGNWTPMQVQWAVKDVTRDDIEDKKFQQLHMEVLVEHDFIDGLHKIFLPLMVVALAACGFMWINLVLQPAYSSPRIGGYTTLILTVIALKLALRGELPVVHYGTLTDALYNMTIVMLLAGLLSSCAVLTLASAGKQELALKWHLRLRYLYPIVYFVAMAMTSVLFLYWIS